MIPKRYRFQAENASGVALAAGDLIILKMTRWKINSSGAKVHDVEAVPLNGGGSLANGGFLTSVDYDDTAAADLWFGAHLNFKATISTATPNGNINYRMQISTDGGVTWPANGTGKHLASINFTATGTKEDSAKEL